MDRHITLMQEALKEAKRAEARDEVPIGAVLVNRKTEAIVQRAGNRTIEFADPTAHAEILVVRAQCAALGVQRLPGYDLYVTLEPCTMCAAALSFARIHTVYFGASDPKGGGVLHGSRFYEQETCHHRPQVEHGFLKEDCGQILRDFFKNKRG